MKLSRSSSESSSSRFWQWWWKGSAPRTPLAAQMSVHVDGILDHAADIQHAAEIEGQRIRHDALDAAARLLARVEAVEVELQQALDTVTAGKQALVEGLAEERARIQQAPANVTPLVRAS
jgi:hypothetical protein